MKPRSSNFPQCLPYNTVAKMMTMDTYVYNNIYHS